MTREDQVLELLAEANPVSDPNLFAQDVRTAARLGDTEQWSGTMTETELRNIEPPAKGKNRRPWLIAAAAAVVALIVGVGAVIAINQSTDDSPAAGAITGPADTLNGYVAAYNDGDIDAVMDFFVEESVVAGHPAGSVESRGIVAIREIHAEVGEGVTYTISITDVTGNTVKWDHLWAGFENGEPFSNCVDGHTAVIEDGKILSWTWPPTNFNCP